MITLGISAYYHDSAIAILQDENIIFALQEERLSRKKADDRFPSLSIKSALDYLSKTNLHKMRGAKYREREREREREQPNLKSSLNPLYPAKSSVQNLNKSTALDSATNHASSVKCHTNSGDSAQNLAQNFTLDSIDNFVFYDKPFLSFERILETYFATVPKGFFSFIKAIPLWLSTKLFLKETIARELCKIYAEIYPHKQTREIKAFKHKILSNLYFAEHHISHLSAAFFPSPFGESGILSIDGVGEWATTTIAKGKGNHIEILREIHFPHSLGLIYSAFTYYLGFKVNSGEYKVMGLAPYGEPKYKELILENLIDVRDDGSFALNMKYFDFLSGLKMTNAKFDALFGYAKRESESELKQIHFDIAASIQAVTNEIMLRLARSTARLTNSRNLVLSGGVALNCVGNGYIYQKLVREEKILDSLWIQPASGDAGSALGCALALHYMEFKNARRIRNSFRHSDGAKRPKNPRIKNDFVLDSSLCTSASLRMTNKADSMQGSYLGLSYTNAQVESTLKSQNAIYEKHSWDALKSIIAKELVQGKVVGFHSGRCEFGPRALGARSILGDPRNTAMQKIMNLKIKYRESFRPFAPSVLDFAVGEYFELDCDSPYMLLVAPVAREKCHTMSEDEQKLFGIDKLNVIRSEIPSVTHIDYSARVQSVHKATNPRYYELLEAFYARTNCPVLVNTSFNVRGEPMVCAPFDSYSCFMGTEMDILVIEDFILYKSAQPKANLIKFKNIKDKYELD